MRIQIFAFLCTFCVVLSCSDGDIITLELDFDQQLSLCGNVNSENYVLFDIKTDPFESLTLLFPSNTTTDKIFNPTESPYTGTISINGSSNRFNYRTYTDEPSGLICEEIPDSNVSIIDDYEASSGTVNFTSVFVDDDNDNVPSAAEDINGNGNLEDDDTDGDGIPNYKDADDDNDNVLTKNENPDPDGNGDLSDAQNTDGTDLPDYLDTDDDNDGVLTRYEDANLNGNLFDDFQAGATVPRFKDVAATDEYINNNLNPNTFTRTVTSTFNIINVDIEILSSDNFFLGTYTKSIVF